MAQNVKFIAVRLQETFDALETKDSLALYWVHDTQRLYKGDKLYGIGLEATTEFAGLMSAEDKAALESLKNGSAGLAGLTPVDGTITLVDTTDGGKSIGVGVSKASGNALVALADGLFVSDTGSTSVPEYAIEKQATAEEGYATSYKLKRTLGDDVSYVGDTINIAKDMVLKSATLEKVTEENVPYEGAVVGDPYIKMMFNDEGASSIYVPVKGLVDTFTAGDGISIVDNKISVVIAENSHGLVSVDGALSVNLATTDSDGAMSKEDKLTLDSIPSVYSVRKYEVSNKPTGTLVNYREDEIRIMCPADTKWQLQVSGEGADPNSYYIGFKAYAPNGAVSFKEDLAEKISDDTMYYFEDNEFAGVDKYGRKYSIVWLPAAQSSDGIWTYFGAMSSLDKYIGWYYTVQWYDANGMIISGDQIRINLSNEDCHYSTKPFYFGEYATKEEFNALEKAVSDMGESYTWGEL